MMSRFFSIAILILIASVCAFSAPKLVTKRIQILTPAHKNLKISDSLNIAIIANIYSDTRSDSLIKMNYPTDSLLAVKAAFALRYKLQESPVFSDYDLPVYNYVRDDSKTLLKALPLDVAKEIAEGVQADNLLTVDIVHSDAWYEVGYSQENNTHMAHAYSHAPFSFIFRYYDIPNNVIKDTQGVGDTLTIETSSSYVVDAMSLFSEILVGSELIIKACELAGETYADLIAPHWVEDIRYFFNDGSSDMRKAGKLADEDKWVEAMEIWVENTNLANQKQAAMYCYNVALACEMLGDFELAIEWLKLANKKNSELPIAEYETVLKKRITDKILIDKYFE